jgi:2-polyprenyl-6-hydroxyphenyl methylase/3-demethylubiquinone-9 3-methyltransferase
MSWRIDIKDWLGGYPYEYASVDEVFNFVKRLGFSLENLKCNIGLMNNEYLFKKL